MPLFPNEAEARETLDVSGYFAVDVVTHLEELWGDFAPYADQHFVQEMLSAVDRMRQFDAAGPDRTKACHDFHIRYWEMYVGCGLLKRRQPLVPYRDRDALGPDHLVIDGEGRVWLECIAPGPGLGADQVPDYTDEGGVHDVPDEQIKFRLTNAVDDKVKAWRDYLKKDIVKPSDRFVIAINDHCVPHASTDWSPPRIARALLGVGNMAVGIDLRTSKWSEPHLTAKRELKKANGSPIRSDWFLTTDVQCVSAVLYSSVDAFNRHVPVERDFVLVANPNAACGLKAGWLSHSTEYAFVRDQGGTRIKTILW